VSRVQILLVSGATLAVLVALGAAVWFVVGSRSLPAAPVAAAPAASARPDAAPLAPAVALDEQSGERSAVAADESEPPPPPVASVRGRVVDPAGASLPQVGVAVALDEGEAPIRGTSDASGSFVLATTALPCSIVVADPRWTTLRSGLVTEESPLAPALVVAAPATKLRGVVLDRDGHPLAGARLALRQAKGADAAGAAPPEDALRGDPGEWRAESGADGTFAFDGAPAIARARLSTRLVEFAPDDRVLDTTPSPAPSVTIVLQPEEPRGPILRGTVVHADGQPAPGADVSFGSAVARTDREGRFRLVCDWFDAGTPLVAAARRSSPVILAGYGAGVDPGARELPPERLVLPATELAITGRVLLASGAPAKGWRVALGDPTRLDPGGASNDVAEARAGRSIELRTDARGGFEFGGLAARTYVVLAAGRDRSSRAEMLVRSDPVAAGSRDVVLQAPDGNPGETIAGRVTGADGAPVAGARVGLGRPALHGAGSEAAMQGRFRAVSGPDGRFEIVGVPAALAYLVVAGEDFLPVRLELPPGAPRSNLVFHVLRRRELSFDGSAASPAPDLLRAIAGGVPAPLWRIAHATPRAADLLRLDDGRSGPIAVGDDVRELVLYRGCRELGRVPVSLDPAGTTRVVWP
jgi:hypothetical protein